MMNKTIDQLLKQESGIRLDVGCGAAKQPGFVGIDLRPLEGVDIVHDVTKFPWPLPDGCALMAMCSHLVEHLPPQSPDPRLTGLIQLLIDNKLIPESQVTEYIGDYSPSPVFMRFMDEVWRVLKVGGTFAIACPHGASPGFLQDPTHVNAINETTFAYFAPSEPYAHGLLWRIYKPKPWRIQNLTWSPAGNIEVILVKLNDPKSDNNGVGT